MSPALPQDSKQTRQRAANLLSVLAFLTSLAALALASGVWQRSQSKVKGADWAQGIQLIAFYEERWDSEEMIQVRAEAATSLLSRTSADEVEFVLAFFDELGLLLSRRVVDAELLWYHFYWPAASYLLAANRLTDAEERAVTYPYLANLLTQLQEVQRERTPRERALRPTENEVDEFLSNEATPPSCEEPESDGEEGEVQMTPL